MILLKNKDSKHMHHIENIKQYVMTNFSEKSYFDRKTKIIILIEKLKSLFFYKNFVFFNFLNLS